LESGTQLITVTASNDYESVTGYFPLVIMQPPVALDVSGPETGSVQSTSTFTATVAPITATLPITYVWSIDEQVILIHPSGITDSVTLPWYQPGLHEVAVSASNRIGVIVDSQPITVFIKLYIPAAYKN
jgi:hypothetical protein